MPHRRPHGQASFRSPHPRPNGSPPRAAGDPVPHASRSDGTRTGLCHGVVHAWLGTCRGPGSTRRRRLQRRRLPHPVATRGLIPPAATWHRGERHSGGWRRAWISGQVGDRVATAERVSRSAATGVGFHPYLSGPRAIHGCRCGRAGQRRSWYTCTASFPTHAPLGAPGSAQVT